MSKVVLNPANVFLRETSRGVYNGFQGEQTPVAELTNLQGYFGAMVKARALYPEQGVIEVQELLEDNEITLKVANTRENWDLLVTAQFSVGHETTRDMSLVFDTHEALTQAKHLLEASSNPYNQHR